MINDPKKQDAIELSESLASKIVDVVNLIRYARVEKSACDGEPRLGRRDIVQGEHIRATPLKLEREETVAGPDVEYPEPSAVGRNRKMREDVGRVIYTRVTTPGCTSIR